MRKIKQILALTFVSTILLTSCNNSSNTSSTSNINDILNNVNGLEGNQDEDDVTNQSIEGLQQLLFKVSKKTRYSYEVTSTVSGSEGHFIDYFEDNCWYNLDDNNDSSFGFAIEKVDETQENGSIKTVDKLFKYYLDKDNNPTSSLYQYTKILSSGEYDVDDTLYGPLNLANLTMLSQISDIEASKISANKFLITDDVACSIFQYMTTYGLSIANYMTSCIIDVINYDTLEFKCTIKLGSYGEITGVFKDLTDKGSILDKTKSKLDDNQLHGHAYYDDTKKFFDLTNNNNFTIKGYNYHLSNGRDLEKNPYTIYCTNNYFYLDFADPNYADYGLVLVNKGTPITYTKKVQNEDGSYTSTEVSQTLQYDSCYGFSMTSEGLKFDSFEGPVETSDLKFAQYDSLDDIPLEDRKEGVLYIVKEEGTSIKVVYQWTKVNNEYTWQRYSGWYNDVGSFYLNSVSATFYPKAMGISMYAYNYLEQSTSNPNYYTTTNSSYMTSLANGLFGWGYQSTTTWMSYVKSAYVSISKDSDNNISSAEVGLSIQGSIEGASYGLQRCYYTYSNFGTTSSNLVETFLTSKGVSF